MNRFGLIVLSDLQFGEKHRFGYPSNISQKVAFDINTLSSRYDFTPEYLLITGDIAETANKDEFDDAIIQLQQLAENISINKENILVVPGNHDISWPLSQVSTEAGDPSLKLSPYEKFLNRLNQNNSICSVANEHYPFIVDTRLGIEFLLLNSCENENHEVHEGYIDKNKLISTLSHNVRKIIEDKRNSLIKIAMLHHRLDTQRGSKEIVTNSEEIESILLSYDYDLVLSGHIHKNQFHIKDIGDMKIIKSGTGSTGINFTERSDGTQNQYNIHIIDRTRTSIIILPRAYNPNSISKFGRGAWKQDNTFDKEILTFEFKEKLNFHPTWSHDNIDSNLMNSLRITSNPFTFSNAEKYPPRLLFDLFVSSDIRHKGATRLTGDAIIRGRRGSGKTMLLRYLEILGEFTFKRNISNKKKSDVLPIMINISQMHSSKKSGTTAELITSADDLIYDEVVFKIKSLSEELRDANFKGTVYKFNQYLNIHSKDNLNKISVLGDAINHAFSTYFDHILLLIDEITPVFPKAFFTNLESGFVSWMNTIRNGGPFFTRFAVYPSDFSDILNEERFGTIVNLEYDVRTEDDSEEFKSYCVDLVNKYFANVSLDKENPSTINKVLELSSNANDSLEQLIYASDGSSRRFLSLMDKCITYISSDHHMDFSPLNKDIVTKIIKDFAQNLFSSYNSSEKQLAISIGKACKRQTTFRFRLPGLSETINNLYARSEELNIIKIAEVGTGTRGTTYEFTFPYCLQMEIHTHNLKETKKVCNSRSLFDGEWITNVTTINKDQLDFFETERRLIGKVTEIEEGILIITVSPDNLESSQSGEYLSDDFPEKIMLDSEVTFIPTENMMAIDVIEIK